ncbi:MAG: hypothetical protein KBD73_03575 [Candidatus Magasanikbacteria bacterium]|nr:hypothetical protein [Candidatus Magasanikbacteria bacterium]
METKVVQYSRCLAIILVVFGFFLPMSVKAASLYVRASTGSYTIGDTLAVTVYVSSADQAMNAASGVLQFPTDKLEVVSLSKTGSIFTLWVQEPAFSNSAGTVSYEGIVLNPGFIGSGGKVITINFKIKSVGISDISFMSGAVLANDGKGVNILSGMSGVHVDHEGGQAPSTSARPDVLAPSARVPGVIKITSQTHPDSDQWYSMSTATFSWDLPSGVTSVRLLADKQESAVPTFRYSTPIKVRTLRDLSDGVWYFSVQTQNSVGWSAVTKYKFQIDTEKPEQFEITPVSEGDPIARKARFMLNAQDSLSGIDYYSITIDGSIGMRWNDDGGHIYGTPELSPGNHELIVAAVDRAGNVVTSSLSFVIASTADINLTEPPRIVLYQNKNIEGDALFVVGTTKYPNTEVLVYLKRDIDIHEQYTVITDANGYFYFITEKGSKLGRYAVWAKVLDKDGFWSESSDPVVFVVKPASVFAFSSLSATSVGALIGIFTLVLLSLGYGFWHWRQRYGVSSKDLKKEIHRTLRMIVFLEEDMREQLKIIEKVRENRLLTKEEEKIIRRLKKNLQGISDERKDAVE